MFLTYVAIIIALFFAMNIGASGAAATMGPAYGAGAIKKKRLALLLVGLGAFLGAVIGSGQVVKTVGEGIIPANILSVEVVLIILFSATLTLFIANMIGIPLSTSEVTIGSIVGVGVAFQSLFVNNVLFIVSFWLIVPIAAFVIAYCIQKMISYFEKKYPGRLKGAKWKKILSILLILTGFVEAFSAGMNNVANAIGPLIGAGIMEETLGIWLGALFVALGALLLGGAVLETNGKKITKLSKLQGIAVSGTGGALVIVASIFGIPVPLTQATTSAIVGVGTAETGFQLWQKSVIQKIIKVWIVSPVMSLVVSFSLIHTLLMPNPYMMIIVISIFVTTFGSISLYRSTKEEKRSVHNEGGGI
ncbi:inorganic phosphate transporter [Evansella cellulosilytica]|uniref:Phosphate transporter n=1 Tax=Evansella cellulosilytica (strain ATCC 21833 / DSM 2522 / FERM P-1141 / JCM 9156 / N-4) TaxID=649639 RepID=E6U1V0_EVAC2|nr:inorganic phosphate transporter [Evansella cellulosilytica]ADU31597.1 phosphate transporter [Evansella cellulosilytica DSM 2522]